LSRGVSFSKELIATAAFALVRQEGLQALTARAVAHRVGCSVAPVYTAFGSMAELRRNVLEAAARMMESTISWDYDTEPALNLGVGVAVFARDEPRLSLAIHQAGGFRFELRSRFRAALADRLRGRPDTRRLPPPVVDRICDRLWIFTIGIAMSLTYGQAMDESTEGIREALANAADALADAEVRDMRRPPRRRRGSP
jgi:AcrR family transcriptional regulator